MEAYNLQLFYFLSLTDLNSLRREKRQGRILDNLRKVKLKTALCQELVFCHAEAHICTW